MDMVGGLAAPASPVTRGADAQAARAAATPGFGRELKRAMAAGEPVVAPLAELTVPEEMETAAATGEAEEIAAGAAPADAPLPRQPAAPEPRPGEVQRSLELLVPPFRSKLERVIERMREEFGYEVRVVETWRSQDRQEALYAQGRTVEGPTVTWTRDSKHLQGRAADVVIDGGYEDAVAYRRLGRIATEEGLRSLGAMDPGHLELPAGAGLETGRAADARVSAGPRTGTAAGIAAIAQVASVARAAEVAKVAAVASPARVAPPFGAPRLAEATPAVEPTIPAHAILDRATTAAAPPVLVATPQPAPAEAARHPLSGSVLPAAHAETEHAAPETQPRMDTQVRPDTPPRMDTQVRPDTPPRTHTTARDASVPMAAAALSPQPAADLGRRTAGEPETQADLSTTENEGVLPQLGRSSALPTATVAPVASTSGTDFAARVARVLSLRDAAEAAPVTGVTLMVENVEGAAARIRLGLRGAAVGATIDVADPVAATNLNAHLNELRSALERNGLEAGAIVVRGPADVKEAAAGARGIAATQVADAMSQTGRPADTNSSQERGPGTPRRDHDSPGQRQKRQFKENQT